MWVFISYVHSPSTFLLAFKKNSTLTILMIARWASWWWFPTATHRHSFAFLYSFFFLSSLFQQSFLVFSNDLPLSSLTMYSRNDKVCVLLRLLLFLFYVSYFFQSVCVFESFPFYKYINLWSFFFCSWMRGVCYLPHCLCQILL